MKVLITGASGYIGGRLVRRVLDRGHHVRVLTRDARHVAGRPWRSRVEVREGDLLAPETLVGAFEGIEVAYYLVHSMASGGDFARRDRRAAENFARAARGLGHVIYLGGLLPPDGSTSKHLLSRAEIGRILAHAFPTTELRAGPIIGSGSASFEMLRYLTERLPVILAPRWVLNEVQPIGVRDVLSYLTAALERGPSGIVEIGGDRLSFKEMILGYARVRGLRRVVISLPPIVPAAVGARWVGLLTPIPNALAVPLVEGMVHSLVVSDPRAQRLFPDIQPMPYSATVRRALHRIRQRAVETRWSGARTEARAYELRDSEGMIREIRRLHVEALPEDVFRVFSGLGGERGWLVWRWAWWSRGVLDGFLGGPGLRRGRRDPQELLPGEAVDFWRVEEVEPPRLLRLRAEVKLPGRGWLQWEAEREGRGTRLTQTASFAPDGLPGVLYWHLLYPFHRMIFTDMIRAIGAGAARSPTPGSAEDDGPVLFPPFSTV